jgi:hypothetical protein
MEASREIEEVEKLDRDGYARKPQCVEESLAWEVEAAWNDEPPVTEPADEARS